MNVLRHMVDAVKTGGVVLDLQVIRPNPAVEVGGRFICELDGEPLFAKADAAAAAVDAAVAAELRDIARPCRTRERCRLRRLGVTRS